MYHVHEEQDTSFIVIRANLPAGEACELLADDEVSHVIAHAVGEAPCYYLLAVEEALPALRAAAAGATVATALQLDTRQPDPVVDPYADSRTAPDRAVVVDGRHVTGYIDAGALPFGMDLTKGLPLGPGAPIPSFATGVHREIASAEAQPLPRAMVTRFPERIRLGDQAPLQVLLSAEVQAGGMPFAAPLGSAITVVVEPVRGVRLLSAGEGVLQVTTEEETLPLRFTFEATETGAARIDVYAYQGVQPLGRTSVGATVVSPYDAVEATETAREPHPLPAVGVNQPDLALYIHQRMRGPHPEFTMRLVSLDASLAQESGTFGPVSFARDPEACFHDVFQEIEDDPLDSRADREAAAYHLESRGYELFETLFPPDLRALLWSLRGRIQTVQIISDEPWVPWEMCKLSGGPPAYEAGPYLCEAFAVTRWKREIDPQPTLTLNKLALVVPADSGLAHAPDEKAHILSLAGPGREVKDIPAKVPNVIRAMRTGQYDGWHFTGHGRYREDSDPNLSALELEDYKRLTPGNLSGPTRRLGNAHPLVFLNACNAGRRAMSLTDVGGWADKFLWAGAGAFIGAHWSIDDQIAFAFAKALYARLLTHNVPIGEAVRKSRLDMRADYPGDPTWLAYTVFADPLARVLPPPRSATLPESAELLGS